MRHSSASTRVRPRRWAIVLSVMNAFVYGVLVVLSRPPKAEGIFEGFVIDYHTPLAARVIIALNAPVIALAALIAELLGALELLVVLIFGIVPAIFLWYLVGLWLDRFQMPARPISASSWRDPSRLIGVAILSSVLLFVALIWPQVLASQHLAELWSFDIVACLIVWPTFVGLVAVRTIWRGIY